MTADIVDFRQHRRDELIEALTVARKWLAYGRSQAKAGQAMITLAEDAISKIEAKLQELDGPAHD